MVLQTSGSGTMKKINRLKALNLIIKKKLWTDKRNVRGVCITEK